LICSAGIAAQIIALRQRCGLNQQQVADLIGVRKTAISQVEKADYQNWSSNTLRNIADALDARIRVLIEPSEDILRQYDGPNDAEEPEIIEFENAEAIDTGNP
jgi:transcriptional regulator with XRE-family HTH domain